MDRALSITALALVALLCSGAQAAPKQDQRVDAAVEVISKFNRIPEQGIPASILRNAYGVAVIPSTLKAGFFVGGRYGRGVLMVRQNDGSWSNPGFITMGGGSLGWQIGAQSTDIVLIFKDQRSVDNIFNGKLTLGGDASVAAGPVGRQTIAATDERLRAEIYSYSRNRGLFAGISLEGSWIGMDKKSNHAYYGNDLSPEQIFTANNLLAPAGAAQLIQLLSTSAPHPEMLAAVSNDNTTAVTTAIETDNTPQVYSLEPLDSGSDELGYAGDETTF